MKRHTNIGGGQKQQSTVAALNLNDRLAFTLGEAAGLLGISRSSAYRLCQRGVLRSSGGMRRKLFSREEVTRFLRATAGGEGA
jgi:excisionase family DNA binding protein